MGKGEACWTCGRRVAPDAGTCAHCGAMLLTLCEECDATQSVYADRCSKCGADMVPRRYRPRRPWRLILAATLLVIIAGSASAWFLLRKDRLDRRWQTLEDAKADYDAQRYQAATVRLLHLLQRWPDEHRAHEQLARSYLAMARFEDAERHARTALDLAPDRIAPHLVLAVCAWQAGDHARAAGHARRILRHTASLSMASMQARAHLLLGKIHTRPDLLDLRLAGHHLQAAVDSGQVDDPEAWLLLAEITMVYESAGIHLASRGGREHYLTRAKEVAQRALSATPGNHPEDHTRNRDLRFLLARVAWIRGEYAEADRQLKRVEDPGPAHRILGARISWKLGRQATALRELNGVLGEVDDPLDLLAVADAFRGLGQKDRARAVEKTALENHPRDVRVLRREIRRRIAAGDPEAARVLAEEGLVHHPDNELLVISLVDALVARPGSTEAAEARLAARAKDPNSEATLRLADLLLDTPPDDPRFLQRLTEAEGLLKIEDPKTPDRLPTYRAFLEGKLALRRRDLDRAVQVLHKLTRSAPADPAVRRLLATAHALRREYELEARELSSLIDLEGRHPDLLLARGEAWLRAGFVRNARDDVTAVRAARPRRADAAILLSRIQTIEDEGRPDRAIETLRNAVETSDDPVRIRVSLGLMLARNGELDAAEEILTEASRLAPSPDARLEVTDALAQVRAARGGSGGSESARRVWLDYLERHPDSVAGPLAFATMLLDSGDAKSARPWIGKVLAADPGNQTALRLRFETCLTGTDDVATAREVARRVREIAPESAIDIYLRGRLALLAGDHEEAARLLRNAAKREPDDPRMAFFLAVACAGVGDHAEAATALQRALEIEPRLGTARVLLADVHVEWAEELIEAGRPSQAAELLSLSLRQSPADARLRALLAKALYHAGFKSNPSLLVRSRALCEGLLRDLEAPDGDLPESYLAPTLQLYAAVLMAQREWKLSAPAFERHLELAPDDASSLRSLGVCRLRQNDARGALPPLEKAHALEPGRLETLLVLLDALTALGRHDEAAALVDRRIAARPDDTMAKTLMARLLHERGKTAEAERIYREALRHDPDHTVGADSLVDLLIFEGRPDEALTFARDHLAKTSRKADARVLLAQALLASQPDSGEAEDHLRAALATGTGRDELHLRALNLLLLYLLQADRADEVRPLEVEFATWLGKRKVALAGGPLAIHATYAWYLLGQAWDVAGVEARAEACYRHALGILPDYGRAMNNLADLVGRTAEKLEEPRRSDRLVAAHQLARRAVEVLPGQPEPLDTLGVILLRQDRAEAALARFREAVAVAEKRDPSHAGLIARLLVSVARAQIALERPGDAKRTISRALALAPELSRDPEVVRLSSEFR
ncbi:MAG: tetratricopeptide repeat protein [Planctomycetota bacterium]